MTTKFQTVSGEIVVSNVGDGPFFPIYFCETCGASNAAFGVAKADLRLSYCGWEGGRPVCVGKGRSEPPR